MAWTRVRSSGHEPLGGVAQRCDGVGDGGANIADEQDQSRQRAAHIVRRVGPIAFARTRGQIGLCGAGRAQQRGDVVGQDLGCHVDVRSFSSFEPTMTSADFCPVTPHVTANPPNLREVEL